LTFNEQLERGEEIADMRRERNMVQRNNSCLCRKYGLRWGDGTELICLLS